ncbi:unnamed protein product [Prorocentrum cordatum]|uniref:Uncharacterized protein n=1 Tax=Prorocentrum cordatum TaxID=2364126 RepID=A0ABN9UBW1_9DINO|nr:unnamed protein product [Polarella glacialis]
MDFNVTSCCSMGARGGRVGGRLPQQGHSCAAGQDMPDLTLAWPGLAPVEPAHAAVGRGAHESEAPAAEVDPEVPCAEPPKGPARSLARQAVTGRGRCGHTSFKVLSARVYIA